MKAELHQRPYPGLAGGASSGAKKCVPLRRYLRIGGEAGNVDQVLCVRDGAFVERGNAAGKRIDKRVEFGVRQCTIDVAITLGEIAWDIVCPEEHLQRTPSADEAGKARHGSATRDQA